MRIKRVVSVSLIVVALLYLAFSLTMEQRKMIGDERGWDPGSRTIPVGIGLITLVASVYLTYKEGRPTEGPGAGPGGAVTGAREIQSEESQSEASSVRRLVILTVGLSVFFIVGFRFLGFILATHTFLFALIYFNCKQDVRWRMVPLFLLSLPVATLVMILFYSIGRYISRQLFLAGRKWEAPILTDKVFTAGAPFLVLSVLLGLLTFLLVRRVKGERHRPAVLAGLVAVGATELLYIVFKQVFWVSLAKGLIFW